VDALLRWRCFGHNGQLRQLARLTPTARAAALRRLRLEHASGGDREHAEGVARMIDQAARAPRYRMGGAGT
jgi:hypothetical protein